MVETLFHLLGVEFARDGDKACDFAFFFRPSPLSFRQVDQHAVACSLLIKAKGKLCQPSWCQDGLK